MGAYKETEGERKEESREACVERRDPCEERDRRQSERVGQRAKLTARQERKLQRRAGTARHTKQPKNGEKQIERERTRAVT